MRQGILLKRMLFINFMKNRILFLFFALFLLSCGNTPPIPYNGYIEGELIFLASPYSGILQKKAVERGQQVKKGQLLFELDPNPEILAIEQSKADLKQARKILQDLQNPSRLPELAALHAQIAQVTEQIELAKLRVQRYRQLVAKQAASKDVLDEAETRYKELQNLKAQYESNLELALQGSREEQINAQKARIEALAANLQQATWRLQQKSVVAPGDGIIFDTYYRQGEFVANQKPIASLLTPDNIRIEFFVPARALSSLHIGQSVNFTCDGCADRNEAVINYISPEAEYIPPLVYTYENRDYLVFRVKAALKNPQRFKPGQPVTITGIANGA
ncbi:HlyD family efflux transporter periplasmic adaptor subunit [Legionella septentrionalis]|uniref:HlyD family efflux transporter periplasmic adaptor subunit n=2 Tax=Legionella septentrionalis TaxID=2498109 RepID=A0A433JIA0_9GAMM|nr:HlyD family efflux transporter periplasmic adaptor subunit [Legionella septentrionalis]RUR02353.1 HlyD family efflux transporter periplasmic adaptor subunit [Legionella septentrionalis]RUR17011.1 HlyD family efflux transporter periplasmic adaptor subunit [Legionella septentrionalis]